MSTTIRRKRGDTFRLRFQKQGGLADTDVAATLKFAALDVPLQVVVLDPEAGIFELSAAGTSAWPTGRGACDIKYSRAGQTLRTETFFVQILEAMTP